MSQALFIAIDSSRRKLQAETRRWALSIGHMGIREAISLARHPPQAESWTRSVVKPDRRVIANVEKTLQRRVGEIPEAHLAECFRMACGALPGLARDIEGRMRDLKRAAEAAPEEPDEGTTPAPE